MASTMYVNTAGQASPDPTKFNDPPPRGYDDTIKRSRARAESARAAAGSAKAAPPPPLVNDTIANPPRPGIAARAAGGIKGAVQTARTVLNTGGGKIGGPLARGLAVFNGLAAPVIGAFEDDSTARYAQRFGMQEPTGDGGVGDIAKFTALRGLGAASDMANGMTMGLAGQFFRDKDWQPPGAGTPAPAPAAQTASVVPPASAIASPQAGGMQQPGPIASRAMPLPQGVTQDGPASFTNVPSMPLSNRVMTPQNQGALDNLVASQPAAQDFESRMGISKDVYDARQRSREGASLQQLGLNRKERGAAMENMGLLGVPGEQGLITRARNAEVQGLEAKNQATQIETEQASRVNDMVGKLLSLNDQNDPDGSQRSSMFENLRALGINKSTYEETPRDKYMRDLSKASAQGGVDRTPAEIQQMIAQGMQAYDTNFQNVDADPTGQAAAPAAAAPNFQEGKVYTDGQGNRARYENGQWVTL